VKTFIAKGRFRNWRVNVYVNLIDTYKVKNRGKKGPNYKNLSFSKSGGPNWGTTEAGDQMNGPPVVKWI
jgi:hypothetical protein